MTGQQHEKNIFASLYVFLSGVAVDMVMNNMRDTGRLTTSICGSYLCCADFFGSSGAVGSHIYSLMSMKAD